MVPRRSARVIIVGYIVLSVLAFLENLEIRVRPELLRFFFSSSTRQFHYVVVLAVLELYVDQAGLDLRSPASAEIKGVCHHC